MHVFRKKGSVNVDIVSLRHYFKQIKLNEFLAWHFDPEFSYKRSESD